MMINPEDNILQRELKHFHREATGNNFDINKKKTSLMIFNATRIYTFSPDFTLGTPKILQTKTEKNLFGLQIQNDLKWGLKLSKWQ